MHELTQILEAAAAGDPMAARELLPLVYDSLRTLAAARMAAEPAGQTLQATAIVHEAYLRLIGGANPENWNSRGHFFAAAAEAMRRILIENARRKKGPMHGGDWQKITLDEAEAEMSGFADNLLNFDEVLTRLRTQDDLAGRLVELRFFTGLTMNQAADVLGIPLRTAERNWKFARAWLHRELSDRPPAES